MEVLRGRMALAVLCAVFVFMEKATGQNIAQSSNQITQSSNINADNVNYNTIQNGYNLGRPTANFIPVVNTGVPQGAQSISSVQQANIQQANLQQASNNFNPYAGSSTSSLSSVSEQSIASASPGVISPAAYSNIQSANIAGLSGQQQYQSVNQNSAISQVQTNQNGQSLSSTSNQVAISNQNVLPTYQNLPINRYPFGGNFEIPLNLEVSLPPVSIAVADQLGQVATQPTSLPPQQPYNPISYGSFPYFPIPYSTGGCSGRSGIRDLLPIFLVALCNNNGGRCGGQGGGCGNGCNNCIPVPVPIPIPFNPVIVKCGANDDSNEEDDTGSKSQTKSAN